MILTKTSPDVRRLRKIENGNWLTLLLRRWNNADDIKTTLIQHGNNVGRWEVEITFV